MKKFLFISITTLLIVAPLSLLGYLIFKNYYFPNGFQAIYDLKSESKYITPLKPLSAVGEIVDTWQAGKAETQLGTFNIEKREIFQPIIDDFVYTDIFLPKKFQKLNLTLLFRADTPELKVCLKTLSDFELVRFRESQGFPKSNNGNPEDPRNRTDQAGWSCQPFYTEKQMGNWFTLGASWDLKEAFEIKPRHYRIGIFAPGLNEKNGALHIKKIQIEAK